MQQSLEEEIKVEQVRKPITRNAEESNEQPAVQADKPQDELGRLFRRC